MKERQQTLRRRVFKYMAAIFGLTFATVILITWFAAFTHGNAITVTINDYNERWVEYVVVPLGWAVCVWWFLVVAGEPFFYSDLYEGG